MATRSGKGAKRVQCWRKQSDGERAPVGDGGNASTPTFWSWKLRPEGSEASSDRGERRRQGSRGGRSSSSSGPIFGTTNHVLEQRLPRPSSCFAGQAEVRVPEGFDQATLMPVDVDVHGLVDRCAWRRWPLDLADGSHLRLHGGNEGALCRAERDGSPTGY